MGQLSIATSRLAPQQTRKHIFIASIQNLNLRHTRHECNANNQYIQNNGHDLADETKDEHFYIVSQTVLYLQCCP